MKSLMAWMMNQMLWQRAEVIANRLQPCLPPIGPFLDIGSGTGHNSRVLRARTGQSILETDVVDMNCLAETVHLFDGQNLPFANEQFTGSLLIFMLHYVDHPEKFLREVERVTREKVIILQTTFVNSRGAALLPIMELLWGRLPFGIARSIGLVKRTRCSLNPARFLSRTALLDILRSSTWKLSDGGSFRWGPLPLFHHLLMLEKP